MRLEPTLKYFYWGVAAFFVASTIIGGVRQFSPVPFFDIWNGAIEFYLNFEQTHDWRLWWAQHNEHRILLARALFWLDLRAFGGTGAFLVCANYTFLGLIVCLFCKILNEAKISSLKYVMPFSIAWLVFWIQNENLTWGFQVQFWMAQLFPLLAFYSYFKYLEVKKLKYFAASMLCALLATGSMANGVLVAPLLLLYAGYSRSGWRSYAAIAVLVVIELATYFSNYSAPGHHGSLLSAVRSDPIGLLHYIALYLGSPFVSIFGDTELAKSIGAGFGIMFVLISVAMVLLQIKKRTTKTDVRGIDKALICYILFMLATAIGTAGGRLVFGVDQSLSSRYTTPVLMGWLALFTVVYSRVLFNFKADWAKYGLLSLLVVMMPVQVKALTVSNTIKFDRSVAALAIALNVLDVKQLNNLWPLSESMLKIAKEAREHEVTIFAQQPLNQFEDKLNTQIKINTINACTGFVDKMEGIDSDPEWTKVTGWFHSENLPKYVWITDEDLKITGVAVIGVQRLDVKNARNIKDENTGFSGYILTRKANDDKYLVGDVDNCVIPVSK